MGGQVIIRVHLVNLQKTVFLRAIGDERGLKAGIHIMDDPLVNIPFGLHLAQHLNIVFLHLVFSGNSHLYLFARQNAHKHFSFFSAPLNVWLGFSGGRLFLAFLSGLFGRGASRLFGKLAIPAIFRRRRLIKHPDQVLFLIVHIRGHGHMQGRHDFAFRAGGPGHGIAKRRRSSIFPLFSRAGVFISAFGR